MKYKVIKEYGKITSQKNKDVELRVQLIAWDDNPPAYDIRSWRNDYAMKGVVLSGEGINNLKKLLADMKPTQNVADKEDDVVKVLTTLPATDCNYKNALKDATQEQIETAIEEMKKGGRNKSRIKACEDRLSGIRASKLAEKYSTKAKGDKSNKKDTKKVVKFPTEKPKIVPLPPSEEKHDYTECCEKLNKEREMFKDADSQFVIDGLLKHCKEDANFRANIMRKDKSYAGAFEYFAGKAKQGYCVRYGNVSYLDNTLALDLAIDYFNMESEG